MIGTSQPRIHSPTVVRDGREASCWPSAVASPTALMGAAAAVVVVVVVVGAPCERWEVVLC